MGGEIFAPPHRHHNDPLTNGSRLTGILSQSVSPVAVARRPGRSGELRHVRDGLRAGDDHVLAGIQHAPGLRQDVLGRGQHGVPTCRRGEQDSF